MRKNIRIIFVCFVLFLFVPNTLIGQTTTTQSFDGATFPPTGWTRSGAAGVVRETTNSSNFPTTSPYSGAGMADVGLYGQSIPVFNTLISKAVDLTYSCASCSPTMSFYIFKDSRWESTTAAASGGSSGNTPAYSYIEVYVNSTQDLNGFPYLLDRVNTRTDMYPIAANGWYKNTYTIPTIFLGQTIYYVFKCYKAGSDDVLMDEVSYTEYTSTPSNMVYTSSTTTQSSTTTSLNASNQQIIGVQLVASGVSSPISLSSLTFNTTGTTSINDIQNAKVWYTGNSGTFSTGNQVGSTIASPNGTFSVTGTQTLTAGTNYFWLTYDVNPDATYTDVLDAQCTSITVGGISQTPTVTNPSGSITINDYTYCAPIFSGGCTANTLTSFQLKQGASALFTQSSFPCPGSLQANTTSLNASTSYTASFSYSATKPTGTAGVADVSDYYLVWIDYNRDGVFSGATELAASGTVNIVAAASGGTQTGTVTSSAFTLLTCYIHGVTRMRIMFERGTAAASTISCSTISSGIYEDYSVTLNSSSPSTFSSVTSSTSSSASVSGGTINQQMVQVVVNTTCGGGALNLSTLTFTTAGSSAASSDISNAKLWYTGNSNTFATNNLFGEVLTPNGTFSFTGLKKLAGTSTYYFWLTYDISSSATAGNTVKAQCSSIFIGGTTQTPASPLIASRSVSLSMKSGMFSACSAKLYDSGGSGTGSGNNSSPAESYAMVLYTLSNSNDSISFQNFALAGQSDVINIYNGVGTSGTLLQTFNGNTAAYPPATAITAKSCNGYGAITIEYLSGSSSAGGSDWAANVYCTAPLVDKWLGAQSGANAIRWSRTGNWSLGVLPSPCYDVLIPITASAKYPTINSSETDSCRSLTINSGGPTLTVTNGGVLNVYGNLSNAGTISYTASASSNGNYLQLYSLLGTVSGTGTYTNFSAMLRTLSAYTLANDITMDNLYLDYGSTVTHSTINLTINSAGSITQRGNWHLGSSTVYYPVSSSSYYPPDLDVRVSKFDAGTSTFYYNSPSAKQDVTAVPYFNLKINNTPSNKTRIGTTTTYSNSGSTGTSCQNLDILLASSNTSGYVCLFNPLTITGNLTIASSCVLDANDHSSGTISSTTDWNINLGGNWINNGTFTNGAGGNASAISNPRTLLLNGINTQSIGGAASSNFYNLTINKASGLTQLTVNTGAAASVIDSIIISKTLTLTNGILDLNTHSIRMTNNSTSSITGGSSSSYILSENTAQKSKINWNVSTTAGSYIFPFGYAGTYIPFTFQLLSGDAGYVSLATYHTGADNTPFPPTVGSLNDTTGTNTNNADNTVDRFWQIDKTGATGAADITFTYLNTEQPLNGEDNLRAQRWSGNSWKTFSSSGTSQVADATANTVKVFGVTAFSPWTLARKLKPLPIELLYFNGVKNADNNVKLDWQTATELKNDYFDVERSNNGIDYQPIAKVIGNGTTKLKHSYTLIDKLKIDDIAYYRLKQVDFNGNYSYSKTIQIKSTESALFNLNAMADVNNGLIKINFSSPNADTYTLMLYDIVGRLLLEQKGEAIKGANKIELNTDMLGRGIYLINLIKKADLSSLKIVY